MERTPQTFDDRFDELATLAFRVAFRITGDREESRDIAQESLARAYARWGSVRERASGWTVTVASNLALDRQRRAARAARRGAEPSASAADHGPGAALRTDVALALRRLPRRQRQVVVLRYLADLPEAEVAQLLGCAPGTVKAHAARGLAALRPLLDTHPADPSEGGRSIGVPTSTATPLAALPVRSTP